MKWPTENQPSSHSITYVFLTAFHSIPSSDSASQAPLYLESDHEATDPKTSLRSDGPQNTHTQSTPARLVVLISSEIPRATHVAVLHCLTAIVINSLQPCMPAQQFGHFLRLSQSAKLVPSPRFLAQTLFIGIIWCTKTSGLTCERRFSSTTRSVHNFSSNFMLKCKSFKCLQVVGQHRPTRVHTARDARSVIV